MVASVPQRWLGRSGDDRAVVRAWSAAATDPLGCQQPFAPEQAQDPFAADVDLMLAAQPGAHLAVDLPGER